METEQNKVVKTLIRLFKPFRVLFVGVVVAMMTYFIGGLLPSEPGAILMFLGLVGFAFTMVYTVVQEFMNSSKRVRQTYKETKGRD